MSDQKADTFTCAHCGGTFEKDWSEEEKAAAEAADLWGITPDDDDAVTVCDDCFQQMHPSQNQDLVAEYFEAFPERRKPAL